MVVVTTGSVDYSHYYITSIFYFILHTRKKVLRAKPLPQLSVEMIVNGTSLLRWGPVLGKRIISNVVSKSWDKSELWQNLGKPIAYLALKTD